MFKPLVNTTSAIRSNTTYENATPAKPSPLVTKLQLKKDTLLVNDKELTVSNSVTTEEIINILAGLV